MPYQNIIVTKENGIARLVINRPEVRNALNIPTRIEIKQAIKELDEDKSVKVVIFIGAGDKAFIAGADVNVFENASPEYIRQFAATLGQQLYNDIEKIRMPTIAAINGFCFGGGLELALCCDIRLASDTAKFGQTEVNIGFSPGGGGTQRLMHVVGWGRAKEMMYTGKILDAAEADRIGLVNRVFPPAKLEAESIELAKSIVSKSPLIIEMIKKNANRAMYSDLASGLAYEVSNFALCFSTEDTREGINAFLEKRPAKFTGK